MALGLSPSELRVNDKICSTDYYWNQEALARMGLSDLLILSHRSPGILMSVNQAGTPGAEAAALAARVGHLKFSRI